VTVAVVGVLISGALALVGAERKNRVLLAVFKPLTTALLFAVVGLPHTAFARWVALGIGLSVVGDAALLWSGNRAFIVGLSAFLLAHISYVVGFNTLGHAGLPALLAAAVIIPITFVLLRTIWAGAAGLQAPTVAYGAVISLMVIFAATTWGSPVIPGPLATLGAALFYVSDSSLAIDRFRRPIPHAAFLTLGVYWLGQLAIAVTARLSGGG